MLLGLFYQVYVWVEGCEWMQKRQRGGLCLTTPSSPNPTLCSTYILPFYGHSLHTTFFRLTHQLASYWVLSSGALAGNWKTADGRRRSVSLDYFASLGCAHRSKGSDAIITGYWGPRAPAQAPHFSQKRGSEPAEGRDCLGLTGPLQCLA